MSKQDYIQLTLFPEDSPASRSVLPGSSEAKMMTVTSGRNLSESYMSCSPLGSLVRMCLESSIWHSTRCLLTWKKKVTKSNVSLFQLAVSMPRTSGTESSLWPTPRVGGSHGSSPVGKKHGDLAAVVGGQLNPEWVEWLMGYEEQFTKLIPTPTATDYKGGCLSRCWRPDSQTVQVERERESRGYDGLLRSLVEVSPWGRIGPMNPAWVEWLMGFPTGWTDLSASGTQSCHSSSSRCSTP